MEGTYVIASLDGNTYELGNISYPSAVTNDGGNELLINDNPGNPGITTESGTNEVTVPLNDAENIVSVGDMIQLDGVTEDVGGISSTQINGNFHVVTQASEKDYVLGMETDLTYSAPPVNTTSSSTTVVINEVDHGLSTGDTVVIAGSDAVGGVPAGELNTTHTIGYIEDSDNFQIPVTTSATSTVVYGGGDSVTIDGVTSTPSPISTTSSSATVTIYQNAHGLAVDDNVTISGAMDVGGIESAYFNKQHTIVSVPDADSFTIVVGTTATSTATGGGNLIIIRVPVKSTSTATGGGSSIESHQKQGTGQETPWKTPFL